MKNISNSKPKTTLITVILIASLLLLLNVFQFLQSDFVSVKKKELTSKNVQLEKTITSAKQEINKYKGISQKLDMVIKKANIKISEQEKKIGLLQSTGSKLKSENLALTAEINLIKEEYLEAIDSLLIYEIDNIGIEMTIEILENEIKELNKKVGKGEVLIADNLNAIPLKKRDNGQQVKTAIAKKVDVVKVCFDLQKSETSKKGLHNVYLRIITPSGRILFEDTEIDEKVRHPMIVGKVNYSSSELIKYKGEKQNNCMKWTVNETLKPGTYIAEVFMTNNVLGTTTFTIK